MGCVTIFIDGFRHAISVKANFLVGRYFSKFLQIVAMAMVDDRQRSTVGNDVTDVTVDGWMLDGIWVSIRVYRCK